jgi:hypothetical protein
MGASACLAAAPVAASSACPGGAQSVRGGFSMAAAAPALPKPVDWGSMRDRTTF